MSYPSDYTIICVFVLALHVDLIVVANGKKKKKTGSNSPKVVFHIELVFLYLIVVGFRSITVSAALKFLHLEREKLRKVSKCFESESRRKMKDLPTST